jgi:arsenate reductase-like glutaredoxin family protein
MVGPEQDSSFCRQVRSCSKRRKTGQAGESHAFYKRRKSMPDREILDRILQTCSFRFRNIVCPNKEKFANIAAAKLQIEDADWSVIECSLQPNGQVKCGMTCLLRDFGEES